MARISAMPRVLEPYLHDLDRNAIVRNANVEYPTRNIGMDIKSVIFTKSSVK